jgi:hypothetical protein
LNQSIDVMFGGGAAIFNVRPLLPFTSFPPLRFSPLSSHSRHYQLRLSYNIIMFTFSTQFFSVECRNMRLLHKAKDIKSFAVHINWGPFHFLFSHRNVYLKYTLILSFSHSFFSLSFSFFHSLIPSSRFHSHSFILSFLLLAFILSFSHSLIPSSHSPSLSFFDSFFSLSFFHSFIPSSHSHSLSFSPDSNEFICV